MVTLDDGIGIASLPGSPSAKSGKEMGLAVDGKDNGGLDNTTATA